MFATFRDVFRISGICLLAAAVLTLVPAVSHAAAVPVWLAKGPSIEGISPAPDLYYDGMAGRILGCAPGSVAAVLARGAEPITLRQGEALYVFLVEDASRAEFEVPARILVRAGHEVLVATTGESPLLTAAADAALHGLKQPVLVRMERPLTVAVPSVPEQPTVADPLIQAMVASLTPTSYHATWQPIDDFETRYYSTAQNEAAAQWLLGKFQSYGLSAELHTYTQSGQQRHNVVATIPGLVDPTKIIYITGHFDSTSPTPSTCAPGADDDGSGTNAVLEAARIMSQYSFQYTIKFACFNGEEQGMLGSAAFTDYIAGLGENVIADFDIDMVAYRGTDAAPPDLVIYTNTNSQPVATAISAAAGIYVPGELEPIIIVDTLEASDYASFWHHGWKAACNIEDEAWGADFCPWYHTCNDRIENYGTNDLNYAVSCSRAIMAAAATTALPFSPSGPFLTLLSTQLDDDNLGGTSGNGDATPNPGEVIDLFATLRNLGNGAATHVTGQLTTTNPHVTIVTGSASWADIPAGGQGTNLSGLRFHVSGLALEGEELPFTLTVTDDSGSRQFALSYTNRAPVLDYYTHALDDLSWGNGNGVIDPGEVLALTVVLANTGGVDASDVHVVLSSLSPRLEVINGNGMADEIPVGGHVPLGLPLTVVVLPDATAGEVLGLSLAITAGAGYQTTSQMNLKVGTRSYDEIEHVGPWSLADADDNATTGRWVQVDPNGTTYNGQQAQPEDDHTADPGHICFVTGQGTVGGAAGEADLDGGKTTLTTPLFDLTGISDPRLTYWRWYTNNLGNNPNQDTWLVQVSSNGGTSWVDLENTTASNNSWVQMSFLLPNYITPTNNVKVRFVASDTGSNSLLEAAVDDVEISGTISPVAVGSPEIPAVLMLAPPPSPSRATVLSYAVPRRAPTSLRLYAADGRCVRTLFDSDVEAGVYRLVWNGRTDSGAPVAPGVYFARLRSGGEVRTQRLVLLK